MARTPKARTLGAALRKEREDRGFTMRDLSERISRNQGDISRWKTGDRTAKPEHVAQILTALGISGEPYNEIMALAYDTDAPMWVATTLPAQRQQLAALVDAEQNASEITEVSPLMIPGLLQTRDYIRAVMSAGDGLSAAEIATRVAIRMGRQDVITRDQPTQFIAFIGEAAIWQIIGNRSVLLEQLRCLMNMAKRPNISLRVLTFGSGWHPGLEGPFILIQPTNSVPVVHLEMRNSGLFLHEEDDVEGYIDAIQAVSQQALSAEESVRLIGKVVQRMEKVE
ncbi:MAG TPA: Scr1 family TA system antitoxin-like transcriptional regulator [Pseudonocardiaceae bacterium]|jgi:transcriptional regulator with XRE-family HTH domain|nr:Scr1 family TA system antitoxin-like transcriptional regulator [Pseudonocardiaceae bacterium]